MFFATDDQKEPTYKYLTDDDMDAWVRGVESMYWRLTLYRVPRFITTQPAMALSRLSKVVSFGRHR